MKAILLAALAAGTIALAGAPASAGSNFSVAAGPSGAPGVQLAQYGGGYEERHERREYREPQYQERREYREPQTYNGYNQNCHRVCVSSDSYGHCVSFRRVCD